MSNRCKILVLTSKTGGGHMSLAEAVRDRLEHEYEVEIVDPQPDFILQHYRLVSRYALWVWAAEFQFSDTPRKSLFAHRRATSIFAKSLNAVLDRVQPHLVITTYPFLTYEVIRVLEKRSSSVPFAMLFSDANGVHASWLTEQNAAANFAPTRETYNQALKVGFPPDRLHLVGWTVRGQFYRTDGPTRDEMLTRLNLDPDRFTIFLQGGGEGAARFGRIVENALAASPEVQLILATGTNAALLTRFQGRKNLYALPFTKEIAPFMAAADVIMGKAGPNTLFESVTLGKPSIITTYIPGQEGANLEFIRRHGLGWIALKPEEQRELIETLVSTPAVLSAMAATVDEYRQWNTEANEAIVPIMRSLLPETCV